VRFAALVVAAAHLAAAPAVLSVGVLRRDGVLIPFAAFDGSKWRPMWVEPTNQDRDVPIDLRSVNKSWWGPAGAPIATWQAWVGSPAPVALTVRQPDIVPVQCDREIALRTDYRAADPPPPLREQPYPKDGLAVAPPHPVERIEVLDRVAPEWAEFRGAVTDSFNTIERGMARAGQLALAQRVRESAPLTIEAIYAYGAGEKRVYFVEASRQYAEGRQACTAVSFGRIWLRRTTTGPNVLRSTVFVQNCDRSETTYMLPLGVVEVANRVFWIAQRSGWYSEGFDVIELKPDGVVVAFYRPGGSC
jgi:hypothetical protein